jgi:hypothetical protein
VVRCASIPFEAVKPCVTPWAQVSQRRVRPCLAGMTKTLQADKRWEGR